MPITGYLKIPDIPGESRRANHEDEIDVFDMSWGLEQAHMSGTGRGRMRAKVEVDPLVVRKYYDASSPYIADAVENGRVFQEVELTLAKDSGEAHLDYLTITMTNVLISSYAVTSGETAQLEDEVEFEFERAKIKYAQFSTDGSTGDTHEVTIGK